MKDKFNIGLILRVFGPLGTFIAVGAFFDSLSNILDWIKPPVALGGVIITPILYVIIRILMGKKKLTFGRLILTEVKKINQVFLGLMLVFIIPLLHGEINASNQIDGISEIGFQDQSEFKILLLPFHPDIECNIISTDYERQLVERYQTKSEAEDLGIEIMLFEEGGCPSTVNQAKSIALEEKADLIIWGQYEDECDIETQIRIRYSLAHELYNADQKQGWNFGDKLSLSPYVAGDTEKRKLPSLDTLRQGYLLEDIDYILYYFLGLKEFWRENYTKSTKLFERALDIKKCDSNSLVWLGQSMIFSIRDSIGIRRVLNKSRLLKKECNSPSSISYFLGYIYNEIGSLDSAKIYFERVIYNNEEYYYRLQARAFLGNILILQDDFENAEIILKDLKKLDPNWVDGYYQLGKLYRKTKRFKEAEQIYLELENLGLVDQSLYQLGLLNLEFEKPDQAKNYLNELLNKAEQSYPHEYQTIGNLYYYLAWSKIQKKDHEAAMRFLKIGLEVDSENTKINNLLNSIETAKKYGSEIELIYARVD